MVDMSKTPRKMSTCVTPFAVLMLASASLYAQQPMSLPLTGAAEVPPVTTMATGTVRIVVRPDRSVSGSVVTSGIDSTMAHVHEAAPDKNGPAIITLTKTAGDSFSVPDGAVLTDAQYASYMAGNLYINVHSAKHPAGEIRAQLQRNESGDTAAIRPGY